MSNIISKEIHLHSRPEGEPKSENFELVEKEISPINEDEAVSYTHLTLPTSDLV